MNERIKELWIEGTQTSIPREGDYSSVSAKNIEKFAELIVRECAQVCVEVGDANSDIYPEFGNGAYFSANRVKQHFGVEE